MLFPLAFILAVEPVLDQVGSASAKLRLRDKDEADLASGGQAGQPI